MMIRLLLPLLLASACASKLPRNLTNKAPGGAALEALDTSAIDFTDLASGQPVNLKQFMEADGRDFLMLTFGSSSCAACNRKAEHLVHEVIGQHPLYLTDAGRRFEIVGINTDTDTSRLGGYFSAYPFIRWNDPSGKVMLDHFMPAGVKFSVPLTVMITRSGVAWRVLPTQQLSVDELMARVEVTLGLRPDGTAPPSTGSDDATVNNGGDGGTDAGTGGATTGGDTTGGTTGGTGTVAADLAVLAPGRLARVTVQDCGGAAKSLADVLGEHDYNFISVERTHCGAACAAQQTALGAAASACAAVGKTCGVATLALDGPDAAQCASGFGFAGGESFVQVFTSFFDWNHHPVVDGVSLSMPEDHAPWLMGFARDGTLALAREGAVAPTAVADALASAGFGAPARGPDFAFHADEGDVGFATLRQRAQFTVVTAGGYLPPPCGSCIEELQRWSEPTQLFDFCDQSAGGCQVFAVSRDYRPAAQTPAQFLATVVDNLTGLGLTRVRVLIDPKVWSDADDAEYYGSFHEGYLTAKFPLPAAESNNPRTVIYDREGKLISVFTSTSASGDDPILAKVKQLLGR